MASDYLGQTITFAAQLDPDLKYTSYVYIRARKHDTIHKIAARRGHPDGAKELLKLNSHIKLKHGHHLRSAFTKLKRHQLIRLPGTWAQQDLVTVHADDPRPIVKGGYAKYDTIDRPGRTGLNRFLGYDPVSLDIAVQFEGYADDAGGPIEDKIATLERMAGRGHFHGAASGPPSVIRVSVTDNRGNVVWLLPPNYQWSPHNTTAPLYRIDNIAWADGALSDSKGRRTRAKAVITIKQYTPLTQIQRSTTQRSKAKKKH